MRNTQSENLKEHSLDVAVIAHSLAVISNMRFGNRLNADHAAVIGMFHDTSEIITGDMPTPVKYQDENFKAMYKQMEETANENLIALLPDDLKAVYTELLTPDGKDEALLTLVKAADKICALIKCMEEKNAGNREFDKAREAQLSSLKEMNLPEVNVFMEEFLPAFELNLDQMQ